MKSKRNLIILAIVIAISLIGVTYAFFDYYMLGSNQKITAGKVNLLFNEGDDTINRANIFPETVTKARSRNDNFITFTVSGVNTSEDEDLYYEIMLNEGDPETGMTRFDPEDLVFDLVELDADGNEGTYLVDAMSYSDFNARRIWVNTVDRNTATTINKTYKLRMWLSEDVMISDSNSSADYPATGYENYYASVKVSVYGDFVEKSVPYNYMINLSSVTAITDQKANISEVHFVSLSPDEINTRIAASTINADVTDSTKGGNVKAWLETDATDTTKYILYVASDGTTYFPSNCSSMFNSYISVTSFNFENIDTSNSTNMSGMFSNCKGLTSLDLSNWNMSSLTNGAGMFSVCSSLTSINIDNWDLTSLNGINGLGGMFGGCSSLTSLNIDGWKLDDTLGFTSILSGTNITSLELTNFDLSETASVSDMFARCSSLNSLKLSGWNTSNVTNMSGMFSNCGNLTSINISDFITTEVTNMAGMFYGCASLTSLDISNFTFGSVASYFQIFYNMKARTDNLPTIIVKSETEQNWILALNDSNRPISWTVDNVIVKQ